MKREIMKTADGSFTIHLPDIDEHYHSKHGALQEALHVFIDKGLNHKQILQDKNHPINILEIGFGTGLNAILTYSFSKKKDIKIRYTGVEAYPVSKEEWEAMDYGNLIEKGIWETIYEKMYACKWEEHCEIDASFFLKKKQLRFQEIEDVNDYDLIYFDAFGARVQPELWTEDIFKIMYKAMKPKGVLVTYAAKGSVRRAMQAVGFEVERLEGPPGKREMLRATKNE